MEDVGLPFSGWAVLELMGHRRLAGFVQEVTLAGAGMLRIDVPGKDNAATQFFSPSSVYAMTPCSEATARAVAGAGMPAPVNEWELPSLRGKALPASRVDDDDEVDADEPTIVEDLDRLVGEYSIGSVLGTLQDLHYAKDDRVYSILEQARRLVNHEDTSAGVEVIRQARCAQIAQGYDAAHDDAIEGDGRLGSAAAWLLVWGGQYSVSDAPEWASELGSKYRGDRLRVLARAGALVAAEIDRLKRAEANGPGVETPAPVPETIAPAGETVDEEVHL